MPTRFDWSCFARISFLFVYLCNITYNLYIAVFSSFLLFCLQSKLYTLLWINSWQRWVGLWLLLTFQNGEYKKEAIWLIPDTNHLMHKHNSSGRAKIRFSYDTVSRTQITRMAKFYPISVLYRTMRLLIFHHGTRYKMMKKATLIHALSIEENYFNISLYFFVFDC